MNTRLALSSVRAAGQRWRSLVVVAVAIAALGVAAPAAHAATATSCSQNHVLWSPVQQITLQPEPYAVLDPTSPNYGIFSSPISLQVFCTDSGQQVPLQGASFSVYAGSNSLTDLRVTIDGSSPKTSSSASVLALYPGFTTLGMGLLSDANGKVSFTMRANSPSHPDLSGPGGSLNLIGVQFDLGTSIPNGSGGQTPVFMAGGGQIFAATPELSPAALISTGLVPALGLILYRRRRTRRAGREALEGDASATQA